MAISPASSHTSPQPAYIKRPCLKLSTQFDKRETNLKVYLYIKVVQNKTVYFKNGLQKVLAENIRVEYIKRLKKIVLK